LNPDFTSVLKHAHLAFEVHRLEQRLVAVAQVGAHPDRRAGDGAARPLAIFKLDRRKPYIWWKVVSA